MSQFFFTIPGVILSIGGIITVVVLGVLYIVGLFKKGKDQEDDRLIKILEGTVNALEQKVDNQKKEHDTMIQDLTVKIEELTETVGHLEKENQTLTKVLQGRDEQTQLFYKKAFEAIDTGNKTFALVEAMNKAHTELMKILVEHLKVVPGVTINNQPK